MGRCGRQSHQLDDRGKVLEDIALRVDADWLAILDDGQRADGASRIRAAQHEGGVPRLDVHGRAPLDRGRRAALRTKPPYAHWRTDVRPGPRYARIRRLEPVHPLSLGSWAGSNHVPFDKSEGSMGPTKVSEGVNRGSATAVLSPVAASLACIGVLLLMGVEVKAAVVAAVVGAVVGSTVSGIARRKENE